MAFVLRSHALPATNPLFGGKTEPPVLHLKVEPCRQVPCPRTQQVTCSPQPPFNDERQAGKLWIPFLKAFWHDSTRGINQKSTDCETDALTTTPWRTNK